jgi:glutathione S-transferase
MGTYETPRVGPMKLYSAWYCPFAQRAWMTLLHKGIAFDYIEVDPYQTEDWWLGLSRGQGKVPVLVAPRVQGDGQITVIDSTRLVEYLDDRLSGAAPLIPANPDGRAETRFWIDHVNERVVPNLYRFLDAQQPGAERNDARDRLLAGVEALSKAMSADGPFFAGKNLNVIDLLMVPFAYRIDALLGYYRDFRLPDTGVAWVRYRRWYETMCDIEIFRATATDHADYRQRLIAHYLPYSQGKGQQDVTQTAT